MWCVWCACVCVGGGEGSPARFPTRFAVRRSRWLLRISEQRLQYAGPWWPSAQGSICSTTSPLSDQMAMAMEGQQNDTIATVTW